MNADKKIIVKQLNQDDIVVYPLSVVIYIEQAFRSIKVKPAFHSISIEPEHIKDLITALQQFLPKE
jgi:hypothetical protein